MIYYTYDDKGAIMGMIYGGQDYIFSKNLQGDVIGIYNSSRQLVAKYTYNAYGEITAITNASGVDVSNNATHIANINPFRYRGYYYDTETGFYYLQSRYYDPVVGRFLNADAFVATGQGILGNNMFAYCGNTPISNYDPNGEFFISTLVACVVIGAVAGGAVGGYASYKKQGKVNWGWVVGGAVVGGALGYWAAPTVVSATGIAGASITIKGGITIIPAVLLGQNHHVLSNPMMKALENHALNGLFERAGSLVQALYKHSHNGYQTWHRAIDNYMVNWLKNNPNASPNQFWRELYNQYNTKDMIKRFGEGVLNYIKAQMK